MGIGQPVVWAPQAGPQHRFIKCPVFEVVYGGARGGGKTDAALGDFAIHAELYGANAKGLFVRRTLVALLPTIDRAKQIFGQLGAVWKEVDKLFRFPNGAVIYFRYLDRDADADAYQGHDYTRVYVEELTQFASPKPVDKLKATLRSAAGVPTGFRATCNPGGPGHTWVKARYIDPGAWQIVREDFTNPFTGETVKLGRVFIPAKLSDNPRLLNNDPLYVAKLQLSGSAELVRAWLEGDWNIVEGAFFDKWSARNVVKPFEVPAQWMRFRSFDWGSAKPFSVGWWAVATDAHQLADGRRIQRGALVRYREWYGSTGKPDEGLKMTAEEVAAGIVSRTPKGETITYSVADPAIFARDGGPSLAERMARSGIAWRPADNARVARQGAVGGWDQLRARIGGNDDGPMLVVFETCRDFIRTVPVLQHDPDRPEDLDTSAEDHCFTGETEVLTPLGPVRIDRLPNSGTIIGPDGHAAFYRNPRVISSVSRLVRVSWASGAYVDCTDDHEFLTEGGWCQAKELCGQRVLLPSSLSARLCRSLTASVTTDAEPTFRKRASDFIGSFGSTISDQCRMAFTSTMRTMTEPTIKLATSTWSPPTSTPSITTGRLGLASERSRSPVRQPRSGMAALRARSGIASTTSATSGRSTPRKWPWCVNSVAAAMRRSLTWLIRRGFAAAPASSALCVSVEPLNERRPVWCLTVPDWGAFVLANGAVVKNCADEARYACMSRPWIARPPVKGNNPPDLWGRQREEAVGWKVA